MSSFSVPLLPLVLCVVAIIGLLVPKPPSDSNARMDRISNVAYIDTFMSITEVREAFKHCGRILGIYHWRSCTLNANRNHFFLEFVEKASVEHARALQIFQTKVYFLSHTPQLITHFESIAPTNYSSMLGVKRESTEDLQKPVGPPRVPAAAKRQQQQQQAGHSNTLPGRVMVDLNTRRRSVDVAPTIQQDVSTSTSRPDVSKPSFKTGSRGAMPYSDKENDPPGLSVLPDSPSPHAFSRKEVRTKDTYLEISTLAQTPEHKTMSLPTPSPSVTGSSPLSTLSYGEDAFGYDPETLAEDPMDAIDFLNRTALSAVGRHKWMIAASHFRSKGNTKAALAVLNAMIKAMTSPTVGLSEDDIKPAFLMLASCHNELAKQAKATDSKESDLHFHKAKRCLQKVYGTNTLSLETGSSTAPFRDYVTNSSNLPTGHKLAGDHASAQNLQREVQSLRDRQIHHSACLSQLRSTKRKIEEDLDTERHCRRKVERDLEYASRELAASRRAERFAVEQCKREAEARRRGEDRALELRDKMVAMDKEFDALAREISEKERKKRECFGELGVFFLKVAEGEIRFESENLAQVGVSPH